MAGISWQVAGSPSHYIALTEVGEFEIWVDIVNVTAAVLFCAEFPVADRAFKAFLAMHNTFVLPEIIRVIKDLMTYLTSVHLPRMHLGMIHVR